MTKIIALDQIKIGYRQRKSGDISDLIHSIKQNGLLHPLVIFPKDGQYLLVCGGRRLAALKALKQSSTLCTVLNPNIPADRLKLMELNENLRRRDFCWDEHIKAIGDMYYLIRESNRTFTLSKLSDMLNQSPALTSYQMDLYVGLQDYPELSEYDTASKATMELKRLKEDVLVAQKKRNIQESIQQKLKDAGLIQPNKNTITPQNSQRLFDLSTSTYHIFNSAEELLKSLPNNSIDCIATDPPFGINIQQTKGRVKGPQIYKDDYDDSPEAYRELMGDIIPLMIQTLKPSGHIYFFFSVQHYEWLLGEFRKAGGKPHIHPLIWLKGNRVSSTQASIAPVLNYQPIMFITKSTPRQFKSQLRTILPETPPLDSSKRSHPLETPHIVFLNLIEKSTNWGDLIVDPFCGSGSSLVAGLLKNCKVIGADTVSKYRQRAEERIIQTLTRKQFGKT